MSSIIRSTKEHYDYAKKEVLDTLEGIKNPPYQKIDEKFVQIETQLNRFGWIPVVSIGTGIARECLGLAQIVIGITYALLRHISANFTKDPEVKQKLYKQAEIEMSYVINGLGNIVRGEIERFTIWNLQAIVINKIALFLYDMTQLRMNYGYEDSTQKHTYMRSFLAEERLLTPKKLIEV